MSDYIEIYYGSNVPRNYTTNHICHISGKEYINFRPSNADGSGERILVFLKDRLDECTTDAQRELCKKAFTEKELVKFMHSLHFT